MLKKNSYLITGGTGSFGKAFVKKLINSGKKISRLVIFSRDELKQFEMAQMFPVKKYPFIRFFIGDIRDSNRVISAAESIETIIHAAALKQVPTTEYNPFEAIKTNIIGANNLIEAALKNGVKNVIALSTDKASSPINLYGASKLCSDKIFLSANNIKGRRNIKFSIVRYGNVLGSRGSVLPIFLNFFKNKEKFTITHPEMTRFNISLSEGIELVDWCFKNNLGGEIFIPKLKSFNILDLAKSISTSRGYKIIGIRPGEKLHEELISLTDGMNTAEGKNVYVVLNGLSELEFKKYLKIKKLKRVNKGFKYSSDNNKEFLNIQSLKTILKKNKFI